MVNLGMGQKGSLIEIDAGEDIFLRRRSARDARSAGTGAFTSTPAAEHQQPYPLQGGVGRQAVGGGGGRDPMREGHQGGVRRRGR